MAAYKQPKATDEEKAARVRGIQAAMREAIAAPLDVMRACAAAAEQGVVVAGTRQSLGVERRAGRRSSCSGRGCAARS